MNYILFFPDEMRADSVSCYGNPTVKMPNYDRVAKEGVKFENCFVQHPVCSPSRCSLMTGWYPHVNGHRTLWNLLRENEPSLFQYMKDAGYDIQVFGKNDVFSFEHMPKALEKYKDLDPKKAKKVRKKVNQEDFYDENKYTEEEFYSFLRPPLKCDKEETSDMQNVKSAINYMKEHKDSKRPFMMFLPILNPHAPYTVPEEFYNLYGIDEIPELLPSDLENKPDFYKLIRKYRKLDKLPKEHFKKIMSVYLGMNSYVDWMLGKLLDTLQETGLDKNTTIIIASDHGDWAGDYGLVEKWPSALDDKIVKVPLIIKSPGKKEGHIVKEQVELFDIMPTVMELSGLTIKHNHFAKSLVSQLNGEKGDPERAVFAEGGYNKDEPNCFEGFSGRKDVDITKMEGNLYYPKGQQQQKNPESVCRSTMMRTLNYKLIYRSQGVNELYDMKNDPDELNNLYYNNKYEKIRLDMENRLLKWYIDTSDVTPWDEHSRDFPVE